jgi:GNAT superfamily N-acetyltransferase
VTVRVGPLRRDYVGRMGGPARLAGDRPTLVFADEVLLSHEALVAYDEAGTRLGQLVFTEPDRASGADVRVTGVWVQAGHRRRGVATALMREFECRWAGALIDHGARTTEGAAWARTVYAGNHRLTRDGEPAGDEACANYDTGDPGVL